ncbi:hypothetical protein SAMN06265348_110267 [Pedobacter westerhofensis]|uniref:Uncharacterized protein n=1 Tax=Pedobacter westerhofensis TaxID=425512 RepID=A0A521F9H7_9SPHI|nr:DUF6717 family protein [Pedobacter westerhofensis]SMO92271.1 hypothetical protein SAMN06265348_110267 [Pedobacter westerhofensis]
MKQTFKFYKTAAERWYIDLPEWTGSIDDLEMVQGADTMLDKVADGKNECRLILSDQPFEGADVITLLTDLTGLIGGGDYIMETYRGVSINQSMWICSVVTEVFDRVPSVIYVGYPDTDT